MYLLVGIGAVSLLVLIIVYKIAHSETDHLDEFIQKNNTDLSNYNSSKTQSERNALVSIQRIRNYSTVKPKSTYDILLERREWKKFRLNVIYERGGNCEWCGSNKILQVHHKYYLKHPNGSFILPWQYPMDAVLVLCKECHAKAHKKYKINSYYINDATFRSHCCLYN